MVKSLLSSYFYSKMGIFLNQKFIKNIDQFPEKNIFDFNYKIVTDTSKFWIKAKK